MVFGTLQDALNKHDPAVTLTSQHRPQGAPAGPLTCSDTSGLTCPISNSISVPQEICYIAVQLQHSCHTTTRASIAGEWTHIPTGKTLAPLKKNNSSTKLSFDSFS